MKLKKHKWDCSPIDKPTLVYTVKASVKEVARNIAAKHWGIDPRAVRVYQVLPSLKSK